MIPKFKFILLSLIILLGFLTGYITKSELFSKPCICPDPSPCPPQYVIYINNEKIKAKGEAKIDMNQQIETLIKNFVQADSMKTAPKQNDKNNSGLLKRWFGSKDYKNKN